MVPPPLLIARMNAARGKTGRFALHLQPGGNAPNEGMHGCRSGTSGIYDRAAQKAIEPGGFLLENQDVGGNVRRRMGKPVRWLRALLPGEVGGRGYRKDLLYPCCLPAFGCWPMRLQGLRESVR